MLLEGRDLIGQSATGSGKTVAFCLPILERLSLSDQRPQALVLCPTRELCAQVAREMRKLGRRHPGLQVRAISGGESMRDQVGALRRGVHVVVGTPGRVLDHLGRGNLKLDSLRTLVLDEADRMLEMGFQTDMESIIEAAPKVRQTVFFSATFPDTIEQMTRRHQREPARITIEDSNVQAEIRHMRLLCQDEDKVLALLSVLGSVPYESALVFCNQKATVAEVERRLHLEGVSVDCLHGDLEQYERDQVMALFRSQSVRVLIATDVAARGIDVEDLDLVVNFDLPSQQELYVHRVGRTGRAGKTGVAVSLVTPREAELLATMTTGAVVESVSFEQPVKREVLCRPPLMQTLRIGAGRKDKLRPGDILGALTGDAGGLSSADIGKIEIHDRFAYVAVAQKLSSNALRSLSNGKIKGRRFKVSLVG